MREELRLAEKVARYEAETGFDKNGNTIRRPSPIFIERARAAELMCTTDTALRQADRRKMWLKQSDKYPQPIQLAGNSNVIYLRKDVKRALKARSVKSKQIEVQENLNLPPRVGLEALAQLTCLSLLQLNINLKKTGFAKAIITDGNKQKIMRRKNVIRFLFGSRSSNQPQATENQSLAKVIWLAKKRREKMIKQAEKICEELDGKWNGNRGMCRCPAHSDKSPSLSISVNDDGDKVLVHCAMGCSQRDVIDALSNMNLWPHRRRRRTRTKNKADYSSLPVQTKQNKTYTADEYAFGKRIRGKYEKEIEMELDLMFQELSPLLHAHDDYDQWIDELADELALAEHFMFEAVAA